MIRNSYTAVVERNTTFAENLATEPYEVAWAREVRVFVRALNLNGCLEAKAEISPDGLHWMDEGTLPVRLDAPGLLSFPLQDFGHWLRIVLTNEAPSPSATVIVYLALKE